MKFGNYLSVGLGVVLLLLIVLVISCKGVQPSSFQDKYADFIAICQSGVVTSYKDKDKQIEVVCQSHSSYPWRTYGLNNMNPGNYDHRKGRIYKQPGQRPDTQPFRQPQEEPLNTPGERQGQEEPSR